MSLTGGGNGGYCPQHKAVKENWSRAGGGEGHEEEEEEEEKASAAVAAGSKGPKLGEKEGKAKKISLPPPPASRATTLTFPSHFFVLIFFPSPFPPPLSPSVSVFGILMPPRRVPFKVSNTVPLKRFYMHTYSIHEEKFLR